MSNASAENLAREANRRALIQVIRGHSHWPLNQLLAHLDGQHGETLAGLRVADLADPTLPEMLTAYDGGPPIDPRLRSRARALVGEAFVISMRKVLADAQGPVGAAYLRARLGGPRWKLQKAVRELESRGEVRRSGATCGTSYELVGAR